MRVLAGQVYAGNGRFEEGWIALDEARGRVLDRGRGSPAETPAAHGVVVPAPVNAHTHAGDAFLRGRVPEGMALAEAVAPPDGFKHRMLRTAPRGDIAAGVARFAGEAREAGCLAVLDFREGGPAGVRLLLDGFRDSGVDAIAYGRPEAPGDDVADLLREAHGIGLSALGDAGPDEARRLSEAARRAERAFALHASEAEREDVDAVLDLDPDFLVHLCAATDDDLAAVAARRVPIVVCPRSNARFGLAPPVDRMLDAGCALALGTDNAMLQSPDVFAELALLLSRYPDRRDALVAAALEGGRGILFGPEGNGSLAPGGRGGVLVLAPDGPDPVHALVASGARILHRS